MCQGENRNSQLTVFTPCTVSQAPPEAEHPEMLQNTLEVQDSSHCTSSLTQDVLQTATLARGTGMDKVPGRQLTGPPVVFCSN